MKRKFLHTLFFCLVLAVSFMLITACQSKVVNKTNSSLASTDTAAPLSDKKEDKQSENVVSNSNDKTINEANPSSFTNNSASTNNSAVNVPASRGGSVASNATQSSSTTASQSKTTAPTKASIKSTEVNPSASKPELLDWWKDAQYVFPRGASAVVQDYYTGKTFKIVRTMGTNHADCEAVTKADTEIIKSIWGGFSWTRRPVIVIINGRRLAASMSAMPHAGIDALPAYQTVDNRSDGYGTGENLDVIKGNGMDGHFDIHFLNSTRHKDNQIDPQHQAMIKIAAGQ